MKWLLLAMLALAGGKAFDDALRQGLMALNANRLEEARAELERAARIKPHEPRVWLGLAQTYWKQHKRPQAEDAASRAERASRQDPLILHALAYFHVEAGDLPKAAGLEARYAEFRPQDADAPGRVIDLYLRAGDAKGAIAFARQALQWAAGPELRYELGKAFALDGQPAQAEAEYREAVKLAPYEESYRFALARQLLATRDFAHALEELDGAVAIFDKSAQLRLARGVALYALRRFPEAIGEFFATIAIAPEVEQPYVFLERMLDQAGDRLPKVAAAFAAFQKANPSSYLGSFLRARAIEAQAGDAAEAAAWMRKSIGQNGAFWGSHFELGVLLERRREFAAAAAEFQRSIQLNPAAPTPHYHLARVYDRLGRGADAAAERALHAKLSAQEEANSGRTQGMGSGLPMLESKPRSSSP